MTSPLKYASVNSKTVPDSKALIYRHTFKMARYKNVGGDNYVGQLLSCEGVLVSRHVAGK